MWDAHFGYLQKQNVAPVLLGEFGTKLETTSDRSWLASMVGYPNVTQMSFAYWSFNPNSGDTGGLVQDDWTTPQTAKLAALRPLLGSPVVPTTFGTTAVTTVPRTTAVTTLQTTTAATAQTNGLTTTGTSTAGRPSAGTVAAAWVMESAWNTGYVANLVLSANGPVSGWSLSWSDPGAQAVTNAWACSAASAPAAFTAKAQIGGRPYRMAAAFGSDCKLLKSGSAFVNPVIAVG